MEKNLISDKVNFSLSDWGWKTPIDDMMQDLYNAKKAGVTHIHVEVHESYGDYELDITPITERLETDEELQTRINQIASRKESKRKMDLAQLKKLKEEYET